MQIQTIKTEDLRVAEYNPRKKSQHVLETVKASLKDYGFLQPIVINTHQCELCGDRRNVIVGGHRRIDAARESGILEVPVVTVNLHIAQEKQANLRLNAQEEFRKSELTGIIQELHSLDAQLTQTIGFDAQEIVEMLYAARYQNNPVKRLLTDQFLIPPFSVFDAKQDYWQKRKHLWLEALGNLAETREGKLAGSGQNLLMMGVNKGVSIFDPVLSEIAYSWFLPIKNGTILDPFAGSLARGGVAAALGHTYHGIEIRKEQIEANLAKLTELNLADKATFYLGNSKDLKALIPETNTYDLIFTCPPYYDLEIYSKQEEDLSTKQTYQEFMEDYRVIFKQCVDRLKDNRFVVIVLGDIRDERGVYRNFISDNIELFESLGLHLYNEIIYVTPLATAPHRAERNMRKRKVVKTHQNILTLYKGDPDLLKNPRLLEIHEKVLTFFKGDPEQIAETFIAPPNIIRDPIPHEPNPEDSAE
ncbi:MAG: ParB N-terminal domain-containing protein [Patescibacteria group bacterium]